MGPPAAKQLDIVLGIDTHIVLIPSPAGPIPTPIPHPHVGILLDPMDFVPGLGTAVKINGLPRAVAGTSGKAVPPHIPMGGPFAVPPGNESELFMGSLTVRADGEPLGYANLPVLSCTDVGMPAPPRPKKTTAKSPMLPTSVALPIPVGPQVLVGGPPSIQGFDVMHTWHHVDDFDPNTGKGTMQLVRTDADEATFPHRGSVSQFEKQFGVKYTAKGGGVEVAHSKGWNKSRKRAKGCKR